MSITAPQERLELAGNVQATGDFIGRSIVLSDNLESKIFQTESCVVAGPLVAEGNIGIGTSNPCSYKLAVDGKIRAHEIKVITLGWADFVFAGNYVLPPLADVEAFIKKNKPLPDIPSEAEVKENGIERGEMNAKLLQKIEELTLYVIEQQKKMEKLKIRNELFEQEILLLKAQK